jgi:hypothetical protein
MPAFLCGSFVYDDFKNKKREAEAIKYVIKWDRGRKFEFCGMLDDTGDFVSNPILFRVDRSGR